jgi:hypothetical protein
MLQGIYSALYGEVNVSVEQCIEIKGAFNVSVEKRIEIKGDYVEK